MRNIMIGAAAIAMAATGAIAQPGNGNGKGGGNGGDRPAAAAKAQGNPGQGNKAQAGKPDRGGPTAKGPSMRQAQADRGPPARAQKAGRGPEAKGQQRAVADNRGNRPNGAGNAQRANRIEDRADRGLVDRDVRSAGYRGVQNAFYDRGSFGLIEGCPPGLAKKNNGCTPPGLARQRSGWSDAFYRPSWYGYSSLGDGRYYYDNGYLYRMNDGGSILGYIPLLGGALSVGNPWPDYYQPVPVPDYYVDYYNLGPSGGYRYADDVLYRVDPQTSAITSIAALLTGDQFAVGQPMPRGYDVYNVPYPYRDRYYDTPDAYYRYSDGYVYQVDPTTQLIAAAIELLT